MLTRREPSGRRIRSAFIVVLGVAIVVDCGGKVGTFRAHGQGGETTGPEPADATGGLGADDEVDERPSTTGGLRTDDVGRARPPATGGVPPEHVIPGIPPAGGVGGVAGAEGVAPATSGMGFGGLADVSPRAGASGAPTPPAPPGQCPPDAPTVCGEACVNTQSDPNHCNRCGHSCQGSVCQGGRCSPRVFSSAGSAPLALAANDEYVYWMVADGLWRGSIAARALERAFESPDPLQAQARMRSALTADAAGAYFVMGLAPYAMPTDGLGAAKLDVDLGYGDSGLALATPTMLAGGATGLYVVTSYAGHEGGPCAYDIRAVALDTGAVRSIPGVCTVRALAVDASALYWTDGAITSSDSVPAHPGVWTAPIAGDSEAVQLVASPGPQGIAVFDGVVYWTDSSLGQVLALQVGADDEPVTIAGSPAPGNLAVDATGVYWVDAESGLLHAPLDGGEVQTLDARPDILAVAVNVTSVFWMTDGQLSWLAK